MKKRIRLNLSRHDAATLLGVIAQAIDESTGEEDGMLLQHDLDCAVRICNRLFGMLQPRWGLDELLNEAIAEAERKDE